MELNSSRASVASDDYSLITYEKCNPPRAKLFIVFLASLVIATIIVLLVVLTRLKPFKDPTSSEMSESSCGNITECHSSQDPEEQCPDIAIFGAGLAGTYTAWRLRDLNKSIVLFESSDKPGGKFYTDHLTGSDYTRHLGASFYIPSMHPLLNYQIESLALETEAFTNVNYSTEQRNYVRGLFVDSDKLCKQTCPYKLRPEENYMSPRHLLSWLLEDMKIDFLPDVDPNTTDWRSILNSEKLKNIILQSASFEAYNYLRDTLYWWEYFPEGNSLTFYDYITENSPAELNKAEWRTIKGGMDRLITEMITQTEQANSRFSVAYQSRLISIDSQPDYSYFLIRRSDGATGNVPICAKHTVLALPPEEVLALRLSLPEVSSVWRSNIDKLLPVPMLRVLIESRRESPLYPDGVHPWADIRTDLPLQDAHVTHSSCLADGQTTTASSTGNESSAGNTTGSEHVLICTTVIQVNIYGDYLQYWTELLRADGYSATDFHDVINVDVTSSVFAHQLGRYVQEILNTNETVQFDLDSLTMTVKLWVDTPSSTPAFHVWKPDVDWNVTSAKLRVPIHDVRVYLTGSAYAPNYLQYWGEGALFSVDQLLDEIAFT